MAKTSRYIIWAHRDAHSVFGAATNPVVRNGLLLAFNTRHGRTLNAIGLTPTWVIRTFAIQLRAHQSVGAVKVPHDLSGVFSVCR